MERTQNYQLNQWSADDRVLRTDFNADNAKIDGAIKAVDARVDAVAGTIPKILFGTYTGDDTASKTISVGFRPKAVLIFREDGSTRYETSVAFCYGGLILDGHPIQITPNSSSPVPITCAEITNSGFRVYYNGTTSSSARPYLNSSNTFHYIAIG